MRLRLAPEANVLQGNHLVLTRDVAAMIESPQRHLARVSLVLIAVSTEAAIAQDDYQVDISLAVLAVDGNENDELLRYRQRPSNYWCEAVDFAAETVYELVARADSTGTPAESTSISIRLEGDDPAVYIGSQYWHSAENGVIEWHGRLDANNALTASFIVPLTGSVIGTFETNSGSYRVSESQYSNYILCKVDVTLPATRID